MRKLRIFLAPLAFVILLPVFLVFSLPFWYKTWMSVVKEDDND